MHPPRLNIILILLFLISSCDVRTSDVSLAAGIPSPTPFQPVTGDTSDSPYAGAAPTPVYLPAVTPLPLAPTEVVILPDSLPTDVTLAEFTLPTSLNPLTGLPPSDPSLLERRPLAIKVANYPRYIRPQSGLTLADQVFEYYIEGGLTRFIAILYGNNSEWVGPVRSGRYFDENIQRMYQAFLVFKFADPRVLDHFKFSDFSEFIVVPTNGSCPPFKLMPTRQIEVYNNSYFYTPEWEDCVARNNLNNNRPVLRSSFYNEMTPLSELQANQIFTYYSEYSYNYWSYVPETQQYARYQETADTHDGKAEKYEPLMDAATATAVHASNIVVLLAPHAFANTFDEEDEVYQIDLTGSGEAYMFRDGVGIVASWHRTNKDQPLLITAANGTLIYMRPGITFYEVIGARSYVDQDAGEWHFHHDTP
jgi:hypothetical protein